MNEIDLRATDDSPVLVTGATGHVGGYSVVRLLDEGYRVRVTIRAADQRDELLARLRQAGAVPDGRMEFVPAGLTADDGWPEAVQGVRYVLHHASPFPASQPKDEDEVIRPARDGALRVLAAARAAGVSRVVLTSSYAAVGYTIKPDGHYSEADWTNPDDDLPPYIKSKTIAELAAWEYVRTHGGPELSVINPTGIFGPLLGPRVSASTGLVRILLAGETAGGPGLHFGVVDVRDVVDLHLRAMRHPGAAGERFIGVAGPAISFLDMAQILARHLPDRADRIPVRELAEERARSGNQTGRETPGLADQVPVISNEKARTMLGWQPRDVARTIADTADSLIEYGLVTL